MLQFPADQWWGWVSMKVPPNDFPTREPLTTSTVSIRLMQVGIWNRPHPCIQDAGPDATEQNHHLLSPVSPGWCFRGEQLGFQMQAAPWDWTHDHCPQYIPLYLIYLPYGSLVPVAAMEGAKGCYQEPMCAHTTSTHLLHTHTHTTMQHIHPYHHPSALNIDPTRAHTHPIQHVPHFTEAHPPHNTCQRTHILIT